MSGPSRGRRAAHRADRLDAKKPGERTGSRPKPPEAGARSASLEPGRAPGYSDQSQLLPRFVEKGGVQPPDIRENGIRGAPWAAVNVCIPWRRLGQSSEAGQESAPGGCANMVAEAGRAKAAYRSTGACLFAVDPCHGFAQFVPPPRKTRRLLAKTPDLPGSSAQRARCPETWLRLNAQAAPRPRQLDPGAQRSSRAIECREFDVALPFEIASVDASIGWRARLLGSLVAGEDGTAFPGYAAFAPISTSAVGPRAGQARRACLERAASRASCTCIQANQSGNRMMRKFRRSHSAPSGKCRS